MFASSTTSQSRRRPRYRCLQHYAHVTPNTYLASAKSRHTLAPSNPLPGPRPPIIESGVSTRSPSTPVIHSADDWSMGLLWTCHLLPMSLMITDSARSSFTSPPNLPDQARNFLAPSDQCVPRSLTSRHLWIESLDVPSTAVATMC